MDSSFALLAEPLQHSANIDARFGTLNAVFEQWPRVSNHFRVAGPRYLG